MRRRWMLVTVTGASMEPALRAGDRVLVRRRPAHRVRRGELVVLRDEDRDGSPSWIVKRVAAVPGDPVPPELRGRIRRDVVPSGRLVLLGDNPRQSADSRHRGLYDARRLAGVVVRHTHRRDDTHDHRAGPNGDPPAVRDDRSSSAGPVVLAGGDE